MGSGATARPVSCRQQYEVWTRGSALAEDRMQAAVTTVQAAEQSENAAAIRSALNRLMPAALVAAQAPPPRKDLKTIDSQLAADGNRVMAKNM
jgi:hypothetical protein